VESVLGASPRFRQRLAYVPVFGHPVWVDDTHFNLNYHLRHTSLPRPGGLRALKRLAGRILSQKLDRGKPLWEMWVVDGLEEDRFALIVKAHHCMVDGISGLELLTRMLRADPDPTVEPAGRWIPRPAPTRGRMIAEELLSFAEVVRAGLAPTASTPLNPDIGPHRRFDWTRFDLASLQEVKERFGGTLNDVVLSCAAGAIGRFLSSRGMRLTGEVFRAQVPMSIRSQASSGEVGNRVVMLLADLPIAERDPVKRLQRVIETTRKLKRSRQRAGVELLEEISNRALTSIFLSFARIATRQRAFNVVITNVPGPPPAVYLLGARMREIYPLVPLAANQALGIALFSYHGGLYWGFNACWDSLPDLHHLVGYVDVEFENLLKRTLEEPRVRTSDG
jgi:hypothetical protein